jgi:hypothetical protein
MGNKQQWDKLVGRGINVYGKTGRLSAGFFLK